MKKRCPDNNFVAPELIILLIVLAVASCLETVPPRRDFNPPADHTIREEGFLHMPGLKNPMQNCVDCHGEDLRGGIAPSCYTCHGREW